MADKNFGLFQKVMKRLSQKRVRDLSEVYTTLTFKEIASKSKLGVDQLEGVMTEMINEDLVSASIDQR